MQLDNETIRKTKQAIHLKLGQGIIKSINVNAGIQCNKLLQYAGLSFVFEIAQANLSTNVLFLRPLLSL